MKNNIEKVYGKLPKKVNLKNHKVDLGLLDEDANSALAIVTENVDVLDDLESRSRDLDKKLDEVHSLLFGFDMETTLTRNRLIEAEEQIKDVMQRYEAASEVVGIDPTEVKLYRELQNGLTLTSKYIQWADDNKTLYELPSKIIEIQNVLYDAYN